VDEAGRGPLAGSVVAAAVTLSADLAESLLRESWRGLTDSKQLTAARRDAFYSDITTRPGVGFAVGVATAAEIDTLNILRATHLAMARAVAGLLPVPAAALVDGLPVRGLPVPHEALVGGDGRSLLIAAASVVAKVTRDRMMDALDARYPVYGFARHRGYGTKAHLEALAVHGPCPEHRRSFAPVAQTYLRLGR
jgi:ribonuclease HII